MAARDEHEQTQYVVDRILELHEAGTPLREMAVLFRAGYMSADLEIELTNRQIPFEKWGGIKFLEAAHVKDVLAFLRILENPRDEVSWFRVLSLLPGIGDITARAALALMAERVVGSGGVRRAGAAAARARRACGARRCCSSVLSKPDAAGAERTVSEEIAALRAMYDDILRERYDRAEPRLADLDAARSDRRLVPEPRGVPERARPRAAVEDAGPRRPAPTRRTTRSSSAPRTAPRDASGTPCSSIWAVDGWFPSSRALGSDEETEEERRLMYVAMTRARKHLHAVYPLNAYQSRFGTRVLGRPALPLHRSAACAT